MKKLILIFAVFIPLMSFSQAVTDGLIGDWPFNGNANDESGNGNHGIVNGATLTTDRDGNPNMAYSFSENDYIQIANIGNQSVYSFSVWIKVDENQDSWNMILDYGNRRGGINFVSGTTKIKGFMKNSADGSIYSNSFLIEPNAWHHLVLTVDWIDTKVSNLYIDGELADVGVPLFGTEESGTDLYIGYENGTNYYLNGSLDELNLYNKVLSQNEVLELYFGASYESCCQNIYCIGEKVGIGTNMVPAEYLLAVDGKVIVEEVTVKLSGNWPDYVFEKGYKLMSLEDIKAYVIENKHLPDVPSETEMEANGIDVGMINMLLLKKIEEMTLLMIQMEERISELETEKADGR